MISKVMLLLIRNRKTYPKASKNDPQRRRGGGSWRGPGRLRAEGLKKHKKTGILGAPGTPFCRPFSMKDPKGNPNGDMFDPKFEKKALTN